ncbi:MAG: efflux RND transporter permease subunit [Oligoflexus sp.]
MKRWINFFVERSFVVNLLSVGICGIGLFLLMQLKRDLIPRFEIAMIQVNAVLPGASPASIERELVFPIEEALIGMPAIKRMDSTARSDAASLTIFLKASSGDQDQIVEDIRARLQSLRATLPENLERLEANAYRQDSTEFQAYAITDVAMQNPRDRLWVKGLQENLRRLPGVVQVETSLPDHHLFLEFRSDRLNFYGISLSQVRARVLEYFRLTTLGYLDQGGEQIIIDVKKPIDQLADINALPIKTQLSGQTVVLSDLADISIRSQRQTVENYWNGAPYVYMMIRKDLDSDAIKLKSEIDKALADYQSVQLHPSIEVDSLFDGASLIEQQLVVLRDNGLYGFILVMIFLSVFVGFKTASMTAFSLPIAYLGTAIVLYWLGIAIDLISVIGMILVVGMLVDDAIIVSEKYSQNLEQGMAPPLAAKHAARTLIAPVSGTILTTIVAFLPILLIPSDVGSVFKSIPIVIIAALSLSWLECFFVLPNHLQHFVKKPTPHAKKLFQPIEKLFRIVLSKVLAWRYLVFVSILALLAGSFYLVKEHLKTNFNLRLGPKSLSVVATLNESQSLADTKSKLEELHTQLMSLRDDYPVRVRSIIGRAYFDGKNHLGDRYAQLVVYDNRGQQEQLADEGRLEARIQEIVDQQDLSAFENLTFIVSRSGDSEVKENTATIYVEGDDRLGFSDLTTKVEQAVQDVQGYQAVFYDTDDLISSWQFVVNPKALSTYGLTSGELSSQIASLFSPVKVGQTRLAGESVNIYTELQRKERLEFSDLNRLTILNGQGIEIPLAYLGAWEQTQTLQKISHRNGQRTFQIDVKYDPDQTDLAGFKTAIDLAIAPLRQEYPDFSLSVEAGDEAQDEAKTWILNSTVVAVILILLVLALTLGSLLQPMLVGLAIPFGMIGVLWALYFHGMDLGLMAMIGLLGVAGVAVNDSLIMVYAINDINKRHANVKSRRQNVIEGASSRLRAILLTTITTLGGVFPMAYGWGGDSGFTTPLAFSMGWGILAATLATLFVIPLMLEIIYDLRTASSWLLRCLHFLAFRRQGKHLRESQKEDDGNVSDELATQTVMRVSDS